MRYLCLIYEDEKWWEQASEDDMKKGMADYNAFTESAKKNGHYIGGEALQPTTTAKSVQVRNGKVSTTDGPYVETKEQLGGYYLINAKDLNDAIQVASRIPGAKHGTVEVRPIMEFNQP
ncbi:MAG: YciI family protein [Gemmatimonadales bacterium]